MTAPARHLVALRGDEERLYRQHAARLRRAVAREVNAPAEVVEDACQQAWMILMRSQPDRGPTLFAWLRTVAVRQAWHLAARERQALHLETLTRPTHDNEPPSERAEAWLSGRDDVELRVEAREALRTLARLPERQRRYVAMRVAGFSYEEIAAADGGVSLTAVNRHLVRARRRLSEQQQDAA